MADTTVFTGISQVVVDIGSASQASVDALAPIAGSQIDARAWRSLSITIGVATNTVKWTVYGANAADFSDQVVVQAEASVTATGTSSYVTQPPAYSYYQTEIRSAVSGTAGTATLNWVQKR